MGSPEGLLYEAESALSGLESAPVQGLSVEERFGVSFLSTCQMMPVDALEGAAPFPGKRIESRFYAPHSPEATVRNWFRKRQGA